MLKKRTMRARVAPITSLRQPKPETICRRLQRLSNRQLTTQIQDYRIREEMLHYQQWHRELFYMLSINTSADDGMARFTIGVLLKIEEKTAYDPICLLDWPHSRFIPAGLDRRHPELSSKLQIRGKQTIGTFKKNLYMMMDVIKKAMDRL